MFDKIVLGVDGSRSSDLATETVAALATKLGAQVEIVHVREHDRIISKAGSGPDLETREDAEALLSRTLGVLKTAGVTAHTTQRVAAPNDIAAELISVADETGADLIVVGSRGLSSFSGLLLGSVSHKLVQLAGRPVLVTHDPGRGAAATAAP